MRRVLLLLQFIENFTPSRSKPEGQAAGGVDKNRVKIVPGLPPLRVAHHP